MSTLAPLRFALLGVALLVAPAPGQDPTGRGAKPVDKAALRIKAIEFERKLNLEAYRKYASKREWLAAKHPGKWVVIAGGKLLPIHTDPKRQFRKLYFEPAKSLAEAVAAADKTVPDARHRFIFRLGEDGDHSFKMGMTTKSHVLGDGFYNLLPGEAIVSGRQLFTTGSVVDWS